MRRRAIDVRVLPGQPVDGSGRACVHLFVRDEAGPFVEQHVLHSTIGEDGRHLVVARPTRGRLACDPRRTVAQTVRGGVQTVTVRTDDPRAATCPRCLASADYAEIMKLLGA